MAQQEKQICGEIQIILHLFLALIMGVFIGMSFISESSSVESSLTTFAATQKKLMIGVIDQMRHSLIYFDDDFNLLKEMVQKNFQTKCMSLNNYYIDENPSNEFDIEFFEEFYKKPEIFISVNGFELNRQTQYKDGFREEISFSVINVTPAKFKFGMYSDSEFFSKDDFDRIDICYFAFLRFDPEEIEH